MGANTASTVAYIRKKEKIVRYFDKTKSLYLHDGLS